MRSILSIATILAVAAVFCPLDAQDLADRVNAVRGNTVRLSFPTRPEICGDGKSIGETTADGFTTHTFWSGGYSINNQEFWQLDCRTGPMRLVVERVNGRVTELRAAVGVDWLPDARGTDLGTFTGVEVATWLLDIAAASEGISSVAFLAANAAQDAPIAKRLFEIARDGELSSEVRQRAVRWINRAAEREGMVGQADRLLRELVVARAENVEVRERAIRSLRETNENDVWLRERYSRIDRTQLQERVIRRIGASSSAANVAWLRSLALDANERLELRERALRVIGEKTAGHDEIRALYDRLDRSALKERAVRVVGDNSSPEEKRWIRQVAADRNEPTSVRERAIRILGEDADLATMQQLFRDTEGSSLRERILRMVGAMRTPDAAAWLEHVATDREEAKELRDRAIRLLGEYESTAVRDLFERLNSDDLRDRALRITSERSDRGTTEWLTGIATSTRYSTQIRDRALRLLGERAVATTELAAIYEDVSGTDLRRRVIRLLAERADDAAVDKLRLIAETDPSRDLRRYASRRLDEIR
jgi:hypothetical protein